MFLEDLIENLEFKKATMKGGKVQYEFELKPPEKESILRILAGTLLFENLTPLQVSYATLLNGAIAKSQIPCRLTDGVYRFFNSSGIILSLPYKIGEEDEFIEKLSQIADNFSIEAVIGNLLETEGISKERILALIRGESKVKDMILYLANVCKKEKDYYHKTHDNIDVAGARVTVIEKSSDCSYAQIFLKHKDGTEDAPVYADISYYTNRLLKKAAEELSKGA